MTKKIPLAIVGLGKIATDQHIPAIRQSAEFDLVAAATIAGKLDEVATFTSMEEMLGACPDIEAVALCVPPGPRYDLARLALSAGKHVLLEKPPATSVSAAQILARQADSVGRTLFVTWHSQYARAVNPARAYLASKDILSVEVCWKEDVRIWHPGQEWIWQPGNLGVFDTGINALSILTEILPEAIYVKDAVLSFPENRETPIAADIRFGSEAGYEVAAQFDWRLNHPAQWEMNIKCSDGLCKISDGGDTLRIDGNLIDIESEPEYNLLYRDYAGLIKSGVVRADLSPLQHVADVFTFARREIVDPFWFNN